MTDARILNLSDLRGPKLDLLLKPIGTLDETQELATAIYVALGTDRLAEPDDELPDLVGPDGVADRRGWWGDVDGNELWNWPAPIGCRTWELSRSAIVPNEARIGSTLARAEMYVREAMQPFLDQRVCSRFDVTATRIGRETIRVDLIIYRGPMPAIALQYQVLWNEIIETAFVDPYAY